MIISYIYTYVHTYIHTYRKIENILMGVFLHPNVIRGHELRDHCFVYTVDGKNPAPPWMIKTRRKRDVYHLSTDAGFRNHPP